MMVESQGGDHQIKGSGGEALIAAGLPETGGVTPQSRGSR